MKLIIELDIEINADEEIEAVLDSYFKNQSHLRGRKVTEFNIIKTTEEQESFAVKMAKAKAAKKQLHTNNI